MFNQHNMIYLIVDGSYYCFYRYFALTQWWNAAHPNETLCESPITDADFVQRYKSAFVNKLIELKKKILKMYGKDKTIVPIVAKDCPRKEIWRMQLFPTYKANRNTESSHKAGPFFAMAYNDGLFEQAGFTEIISAPHLEADDCASIACNVLLGRDDDTQVVIITSDMDYLQLMRPGLTLLDLKYKSLTESKKCLGNSQMDLFVKIMTGDTSDCIPSVFPKCGMKTAIKCFEDYNYLQKMLAKYPEASTKMEMNKTLIDMSRIPHDLAEVAYERCKKLLEIGK